MRDAKGVEAVERALKILDCFDPDAKEISLAALSERTGFYKSTILRLAISLERFGLLVRGDNGQFRLGPGTWRLGSNYRNSFDMADLMRPELRTLSQSTNETASFYVRDGNSRVCLFRCEPLRAIRHAIAEGASLPLDRGASGKVLLACSEDECEGKDAITKAGYAVSIGERDPEVAAIAVPVRSDRGRLIGALAVSGLVTRFTKQKRAELLDALRESQRRLDSKMPD
ncbi:IclR family transcriptional regulator [Hoeflea poritis]|uniref:IclR family transcriptional regulator n=1 Tax=Hoeflea poritis TaxID=2993659 RepID=A0ABT4VS65_9HYPH|nr:IclR family transcriptional regulator [Hoeflea poritis]MDA4847549.1 IclR family transcriptional regulator [Hoeflea poritis]